MAEQTWASAPRTSERPSWLRQRWGLIIIGFLLAFGTGLGFAQIVQSSPDWNQGLPWERSVILAIPRPMPPPIDALMMVVPWFGTNISLMPVIGLIILWLWRFRRRADL